ncbi:MAG: HPr family phosphocarrier protein [Desulfobacteraceae bacterium]|uniref:HPr family phosphocarrier protein n=1 Tax=Candidatus Desulfaltia bathyphila TaxID=2841697 RepID=A0A8J6TAW5_9BACT|nr:HPr family phosphocarrier protein [Candidatus Desulfaltia bathyphila]MBL7195240.1 HPr family phosphocarrier protein [Desulfobacterales bacterium]
MQQADFDSTFDEKVRIFSHDYLKCCNYISGFDSHKHGFTKRLYSKLISTSQLLEDFLDFHGAKNNSNWYLYREFTASVRHLSIASYSYKHISNRLVFYDLVNTESFEKEGEITFDFLTSSIMKMAPIILDEAKHLNIPIPDDTFKPAYFPTIPTDEMLDYNIDDKDKDQQKKHIVKIASEFLSIAGNFDQLGFYEPYSMEEILTIVPDKINEVEIRRFEMLAHNLQSSFDTYVIHGGFRFGNRRLKQLRGYISVVFHLLQMIGRLLHFYERHLYEAGYKNIYKKVQDRLASLIDTSTLLDRIINYGLYYVCHFLMTGKALARDILNENIERSSITVGIPVKLGFHSRPSLLVAKIVQHYGGQVELCIKSDRFDASSVLDIQWAGGKIQNENINKVTFEGDTRALKDIEMLASVNYGEDTMGKGVPLPEELNYLR